MKYQEWKEKYVPKVSDEHGIKRNRDQLMQKTAELKEAIRDYSPRESKWSGSVEVDNKKCEQNNCYGQKEWNCNILIRDDVKDGVILHEFLHSCSSSYFSPEDFLMNRSIEEGSVEFLTQEIAGTLGLSHNSAYPYLVSTLRNINEGLGMYETDMEFARRLFEQPMTERFEWLQNKVNECIIHNNKISFEEAEQIMGYIGVLGGDFAG